MTPERWQKVKEIFTLAADANGQARAEIVNRECGGDTELRAAVTRLLEEMDRSGALDDPPWPDPTQTFLPGTVVAERYRIERLLGRGGMGEVYLAADAMLGEGVALKTLRSEIADEADMARRFLREIQLARKVTHPNICRVFDVGVHAGPGVGIPFFTMELLPGRSLAERIAEGPLASGEAREIGLQMARGIHSAHEAGIIHRDFKSGNVMLVDSSQGTRAVVTDFGLARVSRVAAAGAGAAGGSITVRAEARFIGTVRYMSPEQLAGEELMPASDIYSLGIVLYEMLMGTPPFPSSDPVNAAVERASGGMNPRAGLIPGADPALTAVIERCLDHDPARRMTANEVAQALEGNSATGIPRALELGVGRRGWLRTAVAFSSVAVAGGMGWWMWTSRGYKPKPEAARWYAMGVTAMRNTAYHSARKALEQAVAADPGYAVAHARLAETLAEQDYTEASKETLLRALAQAESHPPSGMDAVRLRALQRVLTFDYDGAIPLYERIERESADTDRSGAALDLARLHSRNENLPAAMEAAGRAASLDPQSAAARMELGTLALRGRDAAQADQHLRRAVEIFEAASDYEGLSEALRHRAAALIRQNRAGEAPALLDRAAGVAATMGNVAQQIRVQLASSAVYRNLGDTARARTMADEAIELARAQGIGNLATAGLIEVGNAFFVRGEPGPAERYFLEALEFARRDKGRRNEARALLSLASLYVQHSRAVEAKPMLERALAFYRQGGHRRERVQALTLSGSVLVSEGEPEQARRVFEEQVGEVDRLRDPVLAGQVRSRLAGVLTQLEYLPGALVRLDEAGKLRGAGGGAPEAHRSADRADVLWRLGLGTEAREALARSRALAESVQGGQAQLMTRIGARLAMTALSEGRWSEAAAAAKAAVMPDNSRDFESIRARLAEAEALSLTERHREARVAMKEARRLAEAGNRKYRLAFARLAAASILIRAGEAAEGEAEADSAHGYFAPHEMWESDWRCLAWKAEGRRRQGKDPAEAAESGRESLRRWEGRLGAEAFAVYLRRADLVEVRKFLGG